MTRGQLSAARIGVGAAAAVPAPTALRTERQPSGVFTDAAHPELSWRPAAVGPLQTELMVRPSGGHPVSDNDTHADGRWGTVVESLSHATYQGPPLRPDTSYQWTCRSRVPGGTWSEWADPATFCTGLLGQWTAPFVSLPDDVLLRRSGQRVSYFSAVLDLDELPKRATAYATAMGVYQLRINGTVVPLGEQAPGWTSYEHRLHYQGAEITSMLSAGRNVVTAVLGPGWWAGTVAWFGREIYGDTPAVSVDLRLTGTTDATRSWPTGTHWQLDQGPVLFSDLVMGEVHDQRISEPDGGSAGSRRFGVLRPTPDVVFEQQPFPPMWVHEALPAHTVERLADDRIRVDFGRNLSGRVRLQLTDMADLAGRLVTMRHGEAVTANGQLYTANLRTAKQLDRYLLGPHTDALLTPLFAQHGFRYVEITGVPADRLRAGDLSAEVIHTDMPTVGTFTSAHPLLEGIADAVRWSQKSNFLGIPVDCAQRDERLGWTGDLHLFAPTALLNYDCADMLESWLTALVEDQRNDGAIRDIAPYPHLDPAPRDIQTGQPGWADAVVGVPWELYLRTGRLDVLRRCWSAIRGWLQYLDAVNPGSRLRRADVYGDWNSLTPTDPGIVGTAWYARSAATAARIAAVLGRSDEAAQLRALFRAVRHDFLSAYVNHDGRVAGDTQTGYVVALANDLLPRPLQAPAIRRLMDDIRDKNNHLATGFVGTAWVLPVLTDHGQADLAYRLLTTETFPSWGNQIKLGATTFWEHWDTWQPPDRFQRSSMNSFNHFALATVGQFLYERVGGITPDQRRPGYRHVHFRPHPHRVVGSAGVSLQTPAGQVDSRWTINDQECVLNLTVPNTATLHLPVVLGQPARTIELTAGKHELRLTKQTTSHVASPTGD